MLFQAETYQKIKAGKVTVAFRRWTRPTVKEGGTLTTPAGVLRIRSLRVVAEHEITPADARKAGYETSGDILDFLNSRDDGEIYRVDFVLEGEDPRLALREKNDLSPDEFSTIARKLDKLDQSSTIGPWTRRVLQAIQANEGLISTRLAQKLKVERDWLKPNIRKLKALGLTISLEVGYQISPRGERFLQMEGK